MFTILEGHNHDLGLFQLINGDITRCSRNTVWAQEVVLNNVCMHKDLNSLYSTSSER